MVCEKEIYVDFQEKYEKVRKLIEEDSKHDPESDPYVSKYAARQILFQMKCNLINLLKSSEPNSTEYHKLSGMLCAVWLNLGTVSIDTEELSTGEEQLLNCISEIGDKSLDPALILVMLNALNQLGILWSQRDDANKSKEFLDRAEKLYFDFKEKQTIPYEILDLFKCDGTSNDANLNLEKTHTLTLYYLAQIYGSLKEDLKSAVYCHNTLKRQLENNDFEPIDWALNAATLSQFFMECFGFKQARHHLAAASYILNQYQNELDQIIEDSEIINAKKERLKHRSADVARCWAKYGLMLLNTSRDRLLNNTDDETNGTIISDLAQMELHDDCSVTKADLQQLYFSLNLTVYEEQITDKYILTFDDARLVFLNIQSWLNAAKEYYTLENHASDHVMIVQDVSEMYKALLFFEEDEERQAKMHKRRVDNLEAVVNELNPNFYLLACREIWCELASTYSDILDIKLEKLKGSAIVPTPHALSKINALTEKSLLYFNKFLDSVKEPSTNEMPAVLPENVVKPVLIAYFHIGRLNTKMILLDKNAQLQHLRASLDAYQKLVNYCEKHESAAEIMKAELSACQEMAKLLPLKIQKMTQETNA